ncbi:MAG TPA: hypothetical protein VJS67_06990 [Pseudonocardiaceae bacterium]|nr:hypothetical protein [Pseudonocardiaceae bacterium]
MSEKLCSGVLGALPALILIPNLSSGLTIDISSPFHLTLFAPPAGAGRA